MAISDYLMNYPQAPKLKTNYAANALQNLQGNPFAGLAAAILTPFAAKTDRENEQALQQYQQDTGLAQTLMNWKREDDKTQQSRNDDNLALKLQALQSGINLDKINDPDYIETYLKEREKKALEKTAASWNTDLANAYRIINSPQSTQEQKDFMRSAILYNKDPQMAFSLEKRKAEGKGEGELQYARPLAQEKAIGESLFTQTEDGHLTPIVGSNEDLRRKEEAAKEKEAKRQSIEGADFLTTIVDDALGYLDTHGPAATGFAGLINVIPGTPAYELNNKLDTIRSNVASNALLEIKKAGGTFGALSEKELQLLENKLGKLSVRMSQDELRKNLKQIQQHYANLIDRLREEQEGKSLAADDQFADLSDEELLRGLL